MSDSFATSWTVALLVPLSIGFCRQERWSGLPFPSLVDFPNPGTEPTFPALAGKFFTTSATWAVPDSGATAVIQEDTVKTRWMEMKPETCYSVAKLCSTLGTAPAAYQASLSFTISWSLLKLMSVESVMPSNRLILCHRRLFLLSVFPSIRVFPKESAPQTWIH